MEKQKIIGKLLKTIFKKKEKSQLDEFFLEFRKLEKKVNKLLFRLGRHWDKIIEDDLKNTTKNDS